MVHALEERHICTYIFAPLEGHQLTFIIRNNFIKYTDFETSPCIYNRKGWSFVVSSTFFIYLYVFIIYLLGAAWSISILGLLCQVRWTIIMMAWKIPSNRCHLHLKGMEENPKENCEYKDSLLKINKPVYTTIQYNLTKQLFFFIFLYSFGT